jgi:hypothetical protein
LFVVCWVAVDCGAVPSINDIAHSYILISKANIRNFNGRLRGVDLLRRNLKDLTKK